MRWKHLFVAAALAGAMAACSDDEPTDPGNGDATVTVADNTFQPPTRTVEVGTTVVWNTTGTEGHTVTFDDDDSGTLDQGDTYERTFTEPGTYEYICRFHENEGMTGTIVVQEP